MFNYFLKRLLQSILVMLIVGFVSFSLFNFVGDPVNNMVGQEASEETREEMRARIVSCTDATNTYIPSTAAATTAGFNRNAL